MNLLYLHTYVCSYSKVPNYHAVCSFLGKVPMKPQVHKTKIHLYKAKAQEQQCPVLKGL